jgi:uncharacterized protein
MKWEHIENLEEILKLLNVLDEQKMDRDYPLSWERVHATSCSQIGRLLAIKRGVDTELAAFVCSVHDIGRWYTGRQADHARHGEEPIRRFLDQLKFPADVKEEIVQSVIHHSDKENVGSPLEEIVKDADILDCYLHGDEIKKPFHVARLQKVLQELDIQE